MKRFELAVLIGMIAAVIISSVTAFAGECAEVREQVLRLHVLANSDSQEDQDLKLAVRDAILQETESVFVASASKEEIEDAAREHLDVIEATARAEIARRGYNYPVSATIVNMYFETRQYENATLPAGYYDAVRVVIGEGNGKNWWCVMYPPMCVPAAASSEGQELEQQIQQLGQRPSYEPRFALVELWESFYGSITGKTEKAVR